MGAFDIAVELVLSVEGGYVSDPHDPGGETRFGISKKSHPNVDIVNLTKEQAIDIYRKEYWEKYKLFLLPDVFAVAVFDAIVNEGPRAGIVLFQRVVHLPEDGIIGGRTAAVAFSCNIKNVLIDYFAARAISYAQSSSSQYYLRGWMRRLFQVHTACIESIPNVTVL